MRDLAPEHPTLAHLFPDQLTSLTTASFAITAIAQLSAQLGRAGAAGLALPVDDKQLAPISMGFVPHTRTGTPSRRPARFRRNSPARNCGTGRRVGGHCPRCRWVNRRSAGASRPSRFVVDGDLIVVPYW
ncbi:hypothetical protein Aglo01_41730 [Actinokineospora globicatena]|nr:hypothetical protein Aglo01_41730 [Actinokineospora globicatena]GLW85898.1 hypothetical protein Aglo02_35380 [Actinokineospora globicatena]